MAEPTGKHWVVLGLILAALIGTAVWVSRMDAAPGAGPADPAPEAFAQGIEGAAQKVLYGADRSYERRQLRASFDFYRGFDLRYAGTETYAANAERVWERLLALGKELGEPAEALAGYVAERRRLHAAWTELRGKPPGPAWTAYLESLPGEDGRRARIEERQSGAPEKK